MSASPSDTQTAPSSAPALPPSPAGASASPPRFTLDGSEALENHLAGVCRKILAGVRGLVGGTRLEALLLGGGYGRGEGGVLKTPAGDRPYNDLEFYVGLRGNPWLNERRYHAGLHALAEILTPAAGVEVEFKIFSLARLRRSAVTMHAYDLVMGHRWWWGDEPLLAGCEHHRVAADIPLAEATRLLMNRGSGLLFAQEKLNRREFTPAAADFVARNQAKARLAFGDVVLARFGQYHWSCRERYRRLQALMPGELLPWLTAVRRCHEEGVEFKLRPQRTNLTRDRLREHQEALTILALHLWLWLENHRLGEAFATAREYALSSRDKCPETNPWRNRLVNGQVFGPRALFANASTRYPRERLFHALALLLWEPAALRDPLLRHRLQTELGSAAAEFPELVAGYQSLWRRFN